MVKRVIYTEKRTFEQYDENHFLLYLNEEVIPDYVQPTSGDEKTLPPVTAYAYTGDFSNGGTLTEAKEATYDAFVSGLIRKKYSADRVEAITLNKLSMNKERKAEFDAEFKELENYRQICKEQAKAVLGIQ